MNHKSPQKGIPADSACPENGLEALRKDRVRGSPAREPSGRRVLPPYHATAASRAHSVARSCLSSGMHEPQLVPARNAAPISSTVVSFLPQIAARIALS